MQKSHETRYPPSLSNALLADSFADFFTAKVEKIHTALVAKKRDLSLADDNKLLTNAAELNNFHEVSQEDVKEFAYKPLSKSCCLDPLPASLLKDCFPVLLPTITRMVNLSLTTGVIPDALKIASLSPTLKKPTAEFKQFTNYRPISNLKFISNLVVACVAGVWKGRESGFWARGKHEGRARREGGRETPARKPLFSPSCLLIMYAKMTQL